MIIVIKEYRFLCLEPQPIIRDVSVISVGHMFFFVPTDGTDGHLFIIDCIPTDGTDSHLLYL